MKKIMQLTLAIAFIAAGTINAQQPILNAALPDPSFAMQAADVSLKAVAQVKDDLFAGTEKFAKGATDVTEINLDPKMMGMVGGKKSDGDLASKMNFMVIHSYTYDKPGMYSMDDVEAYRKKLTDWSWSCSIHVRDKSGSTDICSRTGPDHESSEMVILAAEAKELTFIHMSGHMSLEELGKMGNGMNGLQKRKDKE